MDPKHQQYDGSGNYTPSGRAAKAASSAQSHGGGSNPVVSDGPGSSQSFSSKAGDSPKQNVGGKVPSQDAQSGSDKLDNARSINDRRA